MEHYYKRILNRTYCLTHKIGRGGMATVYLAQDASAMNQCVVIKQNDMTRSLEDRQQFEKEAQALIQASEHPQCPRRIPLFRAYFVEAEEGWDGQYLVMNYVPGEDLEALVIRLGHALPYAAAVYWLDQVMEVLEFLHQRTPPIYHHDIKPSNIRISANDANAYLVDFGIAGVTNQRIVSAGFSPPEQYSGLANCDARSEVYSLGATLYALVMGAFPPDALARRHGAPLPPISANVVASQTGRDAIMRALQIDADARFASVTEMRQALRPDVPVHPPAIRVIAQSPTQLVMPPTIAARQTATWWSDPGARMLRLALLGNDRIVTGASMPPGNVSSVKLWEIKRWDVPAQMIGRGDHQEGVTCLAVSRDGAFVASGDWLSAIQLWNVRGGKLELVRVFSKGHRGAITALAFSPDGTLLAAASPAPRAVLQLWEVCRHDATPIVLTRDIIVRGLAFSPDGRWLVAACDDHCLRVWDMQTRAEENKLDAETRNFTGAVLAIAFSPNGDLLAAGGADRAVYLFEVRDRKTRALFPPTEWKRRAVPGTHLGNILHLAFSPNADYLAAAGDATHISIWDVARDQHANPIGPFSDEVVSVAFGAYWYLLVAALKGGSVSLIRLV